MPFLPKEFGSSQKQSCPHLPSKNITPLVDQNRKITVTLNPLGIHVADDCFRSRPDHQRFFQFFPSTVGDYCTFRTETLNMLSFLFHEMLGNQQREVGIDMPCFLEHPVKPCLHRLPDGESAGTNHHAPFDRSIIRKLSRGNHIQIPLGIVFLTGCYIFCHSEIINAEIWRWLYGH